MPSNEERSREGTNVWQLVGQWAKMRKKEASCTTV